MKTDLHSVRAAIRRGERSGTTSGLCPGRAQANVVVLPARLAVDFRRFCELNPKPCPLIEETEPGVVAPPRSAPTADVRRDVPRYRVYRGGQLEDEVEDITALWRPDLVTFLLGCSFTFERALARAGIPLRHQEENKVVPMYVTRRASVPAGVFSGPVVVSMRPVPESRVEDACATTSRYPQAHGAPIHAGGPEALGIEDLSRPNYGDAVTLLRGEVPLFWACGVTALEAARAARSELLITHAPGHMLVTDLEE